MGPGRGKEGRELGFALSPALGLSWHRGPSRNGPDATLKKYRTSLPSLFRHISMGEWYCCALDCDDWFRRKETLTTLSPIARHTGADSRLSQVCPEQHSSKARSPAEGNATA